MVCVTTYLRTSSGLATNLDYSEQLLMANIWLICRAHSSHNVGHTAHII